MERANPSATDRMKPAAAPTPRSLLIHDGELADVRALLESHQIPFIERIGVESPEDRRFPWELVIASARRILELQLPCSSSPPMMIAILSHDARTLRSSLRRTGTTMMVRRPVHPAALRALVLHALYRGPEKRRAARVNVGAPVRVKVGWRPRPAVLVDLSVSGCRLLTERPIEPEQLFRVLLPAGVAGRKPLAVDARVVECRANPDSSLGRFVTTATFYAVSARAHAHLHLAVAMHAEGPATYDGAPRIESASGMAAGPAGAASATRGANHRHAKRPVLDQSVVALVEEGARVLMGRDLSRGGMRVDPNP